MGSAPSGGRRWVDDDGEWRWSPARVFGTGRFRVWSSLGLAPRPYKGGQGLLGRPVSPRPTRGRIWVTTRTPPPLSKPKGGSPSSSRNSFLPSYQTALWESLSWTPPSRVRPARGGPHSAPCPWWIHLQWFDLPAFFILSTNRPV
jgi:hypothetical protein